MLINYDNPFPWIIFVANLIISNQNATIMKIITLFLFFLLSITAYPQLNDDFNDGRFSGNESSPRQINWTGDAAHFIVNEQLQLQLNAPAEAASSQLHTASSRIKNTAWECYVRMDFTLTASNYAKVYLASDEEDLTGELNGLFVRIGHTNKNISLIQSRKGSNNKTLINGEAKRFADSQTSVYIKATLDQYNNFKLYSRLEEEEGFLLEGSCKFTDELASEWFGVVCVYTKTRNKHFFFDDFVIRELREDEQEPGDPHNDDYPTAGDIIFNEIMADPAGHTNQYPEYIELYNTSSKTLQLGGSFFCYDNKEFVLGDYEISPKSYLILCKTTTTELFDGQTNVLGVPSFPALANKGKLLLFKNKVGELVSWFEYSDSMYGDAEKKEGGWSLECIDPHNYSNTSNNWTASEHESGGTPGKENSVREENPDIIPPEIITYDCSDALLTLRFSKPMNRASLSDKNCYIVHSQEYYINKVEGNYPWADEIIIEWNKPIGEGDVFDLELEKAEDITGNKLHDRLITVGYGVEPLPGDIIINELLFNPPTGGEEYVELYNRSDKVLDLRLFSITSRKPSDGSFNKLYPLASLPLFLYPEEYLVITKSEELVCRFFRCQDETFFIELPVIPSIANTSGCVVILNSKEEIVDEFAYNEKMHSSDIKDKKGVSLERVDFNQPADNPANWQSASAESGYGTPGYENSHHGSSPLPDITSGNKITVEYPTPGDHYYRINYELDQYGYLGRLLIYDAAGRLADTLLQNELLERNGSILWDGQKKLPGGVYIIYMEIYNPAGEVQRFKKPVVLKD